MTEYLKMVVVKKLDMLGINPEMWISKQFTEADKKKRERTRKKSTPSIVEETNVGQELPNADGDSENGYLDDMGVEENQNDSMLEATFAEERSIENETELGTLSTASANISRVSHSGVNSNFGGSEAGFTTSSVNEGLTRRRSERQAAKRARLDKLPPLHEESHVRSPSSPPRPLSPMSSDTDFDLSPGTNPGTSSQSPPPSQSSSKFVPRRKPLAKGTCRSSNFRSPLNVNVGENLSRNLIDIHIPSDLVEEFGNLSKDNTKKGLETGGILAGIQLENHFKVTHLIIPEQTARSDRWEVQDERQITNFFVHYPELIMLGLIHTHPRMTSFLSSVDLHALWDYARFNKSLISIVLAPERETSSAYCLTDYGLTEISKFQDTGFHEHRNYGSLYTEANHTVNDVGSFISVQDFRIQR